MEKGRLTMNPVYVGVMLNAAMVALGIVGIFYEHGRSRGIQEQIDKRLTRLENYIFEPKKGE
jgi:hypothetical protein